MLVKLVGERKTHPSHFWLPGELLAKNDYYDSVLHLLQHKKLNLNFPKKITCKKQGLVRKYYRDFGMLKQFFRW